MAKGSTKDRPRDHAPPSVERPRVQRVTGPALDLRGRHHAAAPAPTAPPTPPRPAPPRPAPPVPAPTRHLVDAALIGAKKIKKKCCRSQPRCKGCPVVLMRAARLQESGLTGKDLKKAVKRARAA